MTTDTTTCAIPKCDSPATHHLYLSDERGGLAHRVLCRECYIALTTPDR
ncbi:hypothetical protein [Nocardia sp. NPDC051570]